MSVSYSGPSGATGILWNLGGSLGTSTLSNPNPIYSTPGNYLVTYTALVNSAPVSYSLQIVVNQTPTASFSYQLPSSRCVPMTATFNASGGSPGSQFNWAFGDLTPVITGSALTHTYNVSGSFIPVVTIIDAATGCTAVASPASGGTIHVSSPPIPVIVSSQGYSGCQPPFNTVISGSNSISGSPLPGPLVLYSWSFTGASPGGASGPNPGSVSFGAGVNTISLLVADNNQCSRTATALVTVGNPSLNVTLPGTVCLNAVVPATINTSQAITNWTFTGPSTSSLITVLPNLTTYEDTLHIFTSPGPQFYSVSVSAGFNCVPVVVTGSVFVEQVIAQFTTNPILPPHTSCQPSMVASYSNQSTVNNSSTLSYTWSTTWVGSSNHVKPPFLTATSQSPNATFTLVQNSLNKYTIYKYFIPNIYLLAQSNSIAQCKDLVTHTDMDTLVRPSAYFRTYKKHGCSPLTVVFYDSSQTAPVFPLTSYTWNNGATPPSIITGTLALPPSSGSAIPTQTFTYASPGIYKPYLIVKTNYGCEDTSYLDVITVVNPPTVGGFTVVPSPTACAGASVQVKVAPTPTNSTVHHWHVTSDNGFFSGCTTNTAPSFPFTHVGTHGFTVSAYDHDCEGSAVMTNTILIKGPIGKFRMTTNCNVNKKSVDFSWHLQEVQTATLNYGDGTIKVISANAVGITTVLSSHTYSTRGNYTVTLTSENPATGCGPYVFRQVLKIREPRANIRYNGQNFPDLLSGTDCTKSRFKFQADSSRDAYIDCCNGYTWFFKTPTYTLHPIITRYPTFALNNPQPLQPFIYSGPWQKVVLDSVSKDSLRAIGNYTISLLIKDENGCTDTTTRVFRVANAMPAFTLSPNPRCLSDSLMMVINGTQANQVGNDYITMYKWNFGDGSPIVTSTVSTHSPTHKYANCSSPFQIFTVTCIAVNNIGCTDTLKKTVKVIKPFPDLKVSNLRPCIPKGQSVAVTFSAAPGFNTYSVNFGYPNSSAPWLVYGGSFNNVASSYSIPGTYVATLSVTDYTGCRAFETKTLTPLGQPTANISFGNNVNRFCLPGTPTIISTSSVNVSPITNFNWSMGGPPLPGQATITNILPVTCIHTVQLTTLVGGGYCPSSDTALVFVFDPIASLNLDKNKFCLGDNIKVNIKDSAGVFGWQWFFGDNINQTPIVAGSAQAIQTKTLTYPYTTFPTGGNYGESVLTLLYYAQGGTCLRTSTANILVIKVEPDFKQDNNTYSHCLGIPDNFKDLTFNPHSLPLQYNWSFGGQGSSSAQNPLFTFPQPGVYPVTFSVTVSDYGCKGTATKNMTIFPLPTAFISVPDTSCPAIQFSVTGGGSPGVSGSLTGTINSVASSSVINFSPPAQFSLQSSANSSASYSLQVTDDNGCESTVVSDFVYVQQAISPVKWDTTVIIGQTVPINGYVGSNYTYTWAPVVRDLTCLNCFNPISTTTSNITYSVEVEDTPLACFRTLNIYNIIVDPRTTLDVPTAFTPNADGVNDLIFPDGWGIRKLIYFKVFNRWGQLLFETNEFKRGWDGRFNGVPQNMETYIYQASVETYTNETISKTGTFKLIR